MTKPVHQIISYNPSDSYIASQWTGDKVKTPEPKRFVSVNPLVPTGRFGKMISK